MVVGRKIAYTAIELAVNKGLQDIHENLHRGVRNLVDLGSIFAKGNSQQDFFRSLKNIFKNKKSPYYDIVNHLVHNVDLRIIKTCGINLGYNSWTYGAEKIRKFNKITTGNIPWFIVFDFRQKKEIILTPQEISNILTTGKDIGIYCGIFFVHKKFYLETLIPTLSRHRDNIFLLFIPAKLITAHLVESIAQATNIIIVLETNTINDNKQNKSAAELLFSKKCLYSAYTYYDDNNIDFIMADSYAKQIEALKCPFAFLIRENLRILRNAKQFEEFIKQSRALKSNHLFLIDFYQDLSYVNQKISAKNPFLAIKPDGTIAFNCMDGLRKELNIKSSSLPDILKYIDF